MGFRSRTIVLLCCAAVSAACQVGTGGPAATTALPAASASASPAPAASALPATPATPVAQRVALPVQFHPQRDPDWCDPADLEMWLELDGVTTGLIGEVAIQQAVWNFEVAHNDGFTLAQWHASSYAVAAAFDHFANRSDVGDSTFDDPSSAGAVISRSVAVRHEPVIALVDRGSHYVLVSAVELGPGGAAAPPISIIVNDPWTYGPTRDGYPAIGKSTELTWADFTLRSTPDDPGDVGIWSGRRVLIAAGLPLRG